MSSAVPFEIFFFKVLNFSKTHQEALEKSQASLEVFGSIPLGLFMWFFSPYRIDSSSVLLG